MLRWVVIPTIIGMALGLLAILVVLGCVLHLSDQAHRVPPKSSEMAVVVGIT